ncbi:hypothetical protein V2J09_018426 [Rumex salicifolius]
MGKYVKKGKITGDVTVMDVSQSALGVRTRARTLALQQNPDFCYLQLRNRRLEKARFPPLSPSRKPEKQERNRQGSKQSNRRASQQIQSRRTAGSRLRVESVNPVVTGPDSFTRSKMGEVEVELKIEDAHGMGVETSFGEKNMELDGTVRTTRESTPSSFIRDVGPIGSPGSAVRSTYSGAANQRRAQESVQGSVPSTREIDDLFANLGRQQQKQFMEKYNFDIMNDLPLPGRFEWYGV